MQEAKANKAEKNMEIDKKTTNICRVKQQKYRSSRKKRRSSFAILSLLSGFLLFVLDALLQAVL